MALQKITPQHVERQTRRGGALVSDGTASLTVDGMAPDGFGVRALKSFLADENKYAAWYRWNGPDENHLRRER